MEQFYKLFTPAFGIFIGLLMIIGGIIQSQRVKKKNNGKPSMTSKNGVNYVGGHVASIIGGVIILIIALGMLAFKSLSVIASANTIPLSPEQRIIQIIEIAVYGAMLIGLIIPILSLAIKKKNHTVPVKVKLDHFEINEIAKATDSAPNGIMEANRNRGVFILEDDEFKHEFRLNIDPNVFHEGEVYDAFLENKNTYDSIYLEGNHWGLILVYCLEWFGYILLMFIFSFIKGMN